MKRDAREALQLSHGGLAIQQSAAALRRERHGLWRRCLLALQFVTAAAAGCLLELRRELLAGVAPLLSVAEFAAEEARDLAIGDAMPGLTAREAFDVTLLG